MKMQQNLVMIESHVVSVHVVDGILTYIIIMVPIN
jgi:hypothetical protein